jgi:hypothetical protein
MFGFGRRIRDLEEDRQDLRLMIVRMFAQLEALHILASDTLDYLPRTERQRIVDRLKQFVGRDIPKTKKVEWMDDDERKLYSDELSYFVQMYIESATGNTGHWAREDS